MPNREQLKRHADLVDRMATVRGIDLEEQALRGNVSIDEISDAVSSCTNCTNPEHCQQWLSGRERAEASPEYCRNADLFAELAPK
ncbi:DUF6455 family protein [Falsiruegeria mediterranea]|uniref:DUF6455 domain-containing protein n=1 Tax=Falsiruegeria mediterranea M17 TaxID=1200281 RepID=A0A2R8C7M0_9RHOB|nr:DUF6455 family protein [Falsiruegeria mediterranea]SPJ28398.1 hypothetical protein TRM7615_01897 [Falsiruegeria mediterranea M17]